LGSSDNEFLPRTYSRNTGFDSHGEQRLTNVHASTHEPDLSITIGGSETGMKVKKTTKVLT